MSAPTISYPFPCPLCDAHIELLPGQRCSSCRGDLALVIQIAEQPLHLFNIGVEAIEDDRLLDAVVAFAAVAALAPNQEIGWNALGSALSKGGAQAVAGMAIERASALRSKHSRR